jgi:hypothetical protein
MKTMMAAIAPGPAGSGVSRGTKATLVLAAPESRSVPAQHRDEALGEEEGVDYGL